MTAEIRLNLQGIISPLALLKCKSHLKSMDSGSVLEVVLGDADVIKDLIMILKRSGDTILYKRETADNIHLGIKKA